VRDIEKRHGTPGGAKLEQARRSLEFSLETGPAHELTPMSLHAYLDGLQVDLGTVSNAVSEAYFR